MFGIGKKEVYKSLAERKLEKHLLEFKIMIIETNEYLETGEKMETIERKIAMLWVESSNIAFIGYDYNTLFIVFKTSGAYAYEKVPLSHFDAIIEAESQGKYLNQFIKGKFGYKKLEKYRMSYTLEYPYKKG